MNAFDITVKMPLVFMCVCTEMSREYVNVQVQNQSGHIDYSLHDIYSIQGFIQMEEGGGGWEFLPPFPFLVVY